jgi:hypothetical protein
VWYPSFEEKNMFVLVKLDIYGYSDGGASINGIYGPFDTRDEADALRKRCEKLDLVGVDYAVMTIEAPDNLLSFLNGLGMGAV